MAWFTSARERKLWGWAFLIFTAIFAGAILAGSLVPFVPSEASLGLAFAGGLALAAAAVLGMALRGTEQGSFWAAVAVAAALAMIPVRSGVSAIERTHLFEYGLLAAVLYEALKERRRQGGRVGWPAPAAIGLASSLGWLDEALQNWMPGRVYDLRDVAINALAALVAVFVLTAIGWGRSVVGRRRGVG